MDLTVELSLALGGFTRAEEDKAGTTRLDVLVARLREGGVAAAPDVGDALAKSIQKEHATDPRYWEGVQFLVEQLGLTSPAAARQIDRELATLADPVARYHALYTLGLMTGGLVPKMIQNEHDLRAAVPALWFDLAISAHLGDAAGLQKAIVALVSDQHSPITWTDLRKRIPKLRRALQDKFFSVCGVIANHIANPVDAKLWLRAIDERYGSSLSEAAEPIHLAPVNDNVATEAKNWTRSASAGLFEQLRRFTPLGEMRA